MKEVFHLPCQMEYFHRRLMEHPPFFSASLATPTREKGRQADEAEGRKVIFP